MEIDKKDTAAMPVLSSQEKQKTDLWDAETKLLQVVHHNTQQKNNASAYVTIGQDTQPMPKHHK
jgi:hypothetical protein